MPGPYALEQTAAYDFDALSVTNASAVGLTTSKLNASSMATRCYVTIEVAQVRYRYDGTAPTTSVGHIANIGDILVFEGPVNLTRLQFIATSATATVDVTYEAS